MHKAGFYSFPIGQLASRLMHGRLMVLCKGENGLNVYQLPVKRRITLSLPKYYRKDTSACCTVKSHHCSPKRNLIMSLKHSRHVTFMKLLSQLSVLLLFNCCFCLFVCLFVCFTITTLCQTLPAFPHFPFWGLSSLLRTH